MKKFAAGQVGAVIEISGGLFAIVDEADTNLLRKHSWRPRVKETGATYAVSTAWVNGVRTTVYMHRLIMGAACGQIVDHIDGNPLNNLRSNLRFATLAQNQWNRRRGIANRSGFKGVSWDAGEGLWRAQIRVDGKSFFLGRFSEAKKAAEAYSRAARMHHGEFMRLE